MAVMQPQATPAASRLRLQRHGATRPVIEQQQSARLTTANPPAHGINRRKQTIKKQQHAKKDINNANKDNCVNKGINISDRRLKNLAHRRLNPTQLKTVNPSK
jgi:hypothetical protein